MPATPKLANDKYRAVTRATWIASPADTTIQVTAIPTNLPTYVVLGWNTQYETVFEVTSTSGSSSANYALTGVTKIKGYSGNLPEGLAVNCLNNEEFFNQWGAQIAAVQATADQAANLIAALDASGGQIVPAKGTQKRVASTTSSASPAPNANTTDIFSLTAQAVTGAFQVPTGTATDGQGLVVRIKDSGTARTLTWDSGTGGYTAGGISLPTATIAGKYTHVGFLYVTANSLNKWMCVAAVTQS